MAGDDFSKALQKSAVRNDNDQDFDDLSSIYTAHNNNNMLENTLKRVRDREIALSQMEEQDELGFLNKQLGNISNEIDENDEINEEIKRAEQSQEEQQMSYLQQK